MKHANRLVGCGAFFGLVLIATQLSAVTKTENFDTPPADWTELNTMVEGITSFGYSATNFAGGSSGEAGGNFARNGGNDAVVAYYADTNLGETFSDFDSFSAEGRFYRAEAGADAQILIGFFDSTGGPRTDFLGLELIDNGRATAFGGWGQGLADIDRGPFMNLFEFESYAFDFSYDFLTRELVVNVEDNFGGTFSSSVVVDPDDRITNLDAFGILAGNYVGTLQPPPAFEVFIDDVTYTATPTPPAASFEWTTDGPGNWNDAGNWTPPNGAPPNGDAEAVFGAQITSGATIFTDSDVTVRSIEFNNANSYAVAGLGGVNIAQGSNSSGAINVLQGSHEFQARLNLQSDTTVEIADGAQLDVNNALNLDGNTLTISGDGQMNINNRVTSGGGSVINSGNLGGSGAIGGNLTNAAGGTVGPGNSPGTLTLLGDYIQQVGATLAIELADTAEGLFDVLAVEGAATLEGDLEISLIDGFAPTSGDTFDVMTATSIDVQGLALTGEPGFTFSITGGGGLLDADFDSDDDVDGDDFLVWQTGFGTPSGATRMEGDADEDGDVDGDDFLIWQEEFGSVGGGDGAILRLEFTGAGRASAAVPEPSTLLLLVASLLALVLARRVS